ncbi:hypothetical protein PC118_g6639 [Phytophthora cactorum]|uniref:Uncharacterized protein n=1 Tax=Phytophthora cactorum TaxID=29920 RepID=A0A8T0ZAW2_9STRA|nr:hypothetical protein PC112_g6538 [Phytophthora cactorum]KAG2859361.1 hypothetical protein PC113_g9021 [Phytophthora cactorum]KAG2899467.1 hypothetical protein PC114_g13931 [Phytophthora cactorum]KAG2912438.1 hypothetical protein PC115_g12318 [Phytophthora cactorum]KAG2943947.1 hypothetical protein PC117_g9276 [Phytophthora cactorum]
MSRPRLIQARRDAQLSRAWTRLCRGLPQRSGICGRIRRGVEGAGVPYMCRLTSQGANKDSGFLYPQPNGEVEDKVLLMKYHGTSPSSGMECCCAETCCEERRKYSAGRSWGRTKSR